MTQDLITQERLREPAADLLPANPGVLARPTALISPNEQSFLSGLAKEAKALKVCDAESAKQMAEHLNQLSKGDSYVEAQRLAKAKPYRAEIKLIDELAAPIAAELAPAIAHAKNELAGWKRAEEAERQKAIEAQRKAEAERIAAEAEARRKVEAARQAAENAQREAERLRFEAEEKERRAAADLTAPRTEESFDKGVAGLAASAEADRLAAEAALEAQRQLDEAEALARGAARPSAPAPAAPAPAAPVKLKGVKSRKVVRFLTQPDPLLLAREYLTVDETKLKKAILMGLVPKNAPGVEYIIEDELGGSGR